MRTLGIEGSFVLRSFRLPVLSKVITMALSDTLGGLTSTGFDRFCRFCDVLKMLKRWKLWELRTEKRKRFAGLIFGFGVRVVWRTSKLPRN